MPISLTCTCGALLEIDEKFVGQAITCPDCRRPVTTQPPTPPPKATCPLAVLSLVLSLAGAFTVIGSAAGGVCGLLSWKRLQTAPELGGRRLALAGMGLGAFFTVLMLLAIFSPSVIGVDSLLRQYTYGDDIEYPADFWGNARDENRLTYKVVAKLPSRRWGVVKKLATGEDNNKSLELALADLWDDAHAVCLLVTPEELDRLPSPADVLQHFVKSRFVKWLNHQQSKEYEIGGKGLKQEDVKEQKEEIGDVSYFKTTLVAGGAERQFQFRVFLRGNKVFITAGGTRLRRFSAMEPELNEILKSIDTQDLK